MRLVIVEFLVKFLEQEVCRLNWDIGFVTATMQEIGVQLPRLLEVYDQLFKTRVQKNHSLSFVKKLMCDYKEQFKLFFSSTCPVGSLLAATEETSPLGGVYPRAAVRIRG